MVLRNKKSRSRLTRRAAWPRATRPRLEPLERRLLLTGAPGDSTASSDDLADAYQAALVDFQGPDLVGKDGPLARIGFDLISLYEQKKIHDQRHLGTAFTPSSDAPLQISGDLVTVEFVGTGDVNALRAQLAGLGVQNIAVAGSLFSGDIAITSLDDLAALPSLEFARPSYQPITAAGSVQSQGDAALRSDVARTAFGVDGSGVTVGILSDTFNAVPYAGGVDGVARDISTGDLPANTQILDDLAFGSDEGRGMGQLVHDIAPGAGIQFATAFRSEVSFANNIRLLADSGSDVIVDDVFYFAEPFFQDGVIAQAVDSVVARGIPYFSSAGNSGDESYQSEFVNSGQSGGLFGSVFHDFDPGAGVSTLQQFNIPIFGVAILSFQWDQPFGSLGSAGAANDVDIALVGADGSTFLAGAFVINNGGDPLEIFGFFNDGSFDLDSNGVPDTTFFLRIELFSGAAPGLMKYISFGDGTIATFDTNSSTLVGHANSAGAEAVGASAFLATPAFGVDPPLLNDFSSKGGTPILFDTAGNRLAASVDRLSPEVTGVDGTNTTFFGQDISQDTDAFPNFFGTSAAAPHVAAVAALMMQSTGGPSSIAPQTIYDAMESTAIDIVARIEVFGSQSIIPIPNGQGFDAYSGHGLVDSVAAIQFLLTQISLQDASQLEGNSGLTSFLFPVTFLGDASVPVLVVYATANGSATAPGDYVAATGTLTFTVGGPTTQAITVSVVGDVVVEPNETFQMNIRSSGARVVRTQAIGTILNDDVDLSINNVSVVEGNAGTSNAVFTVAAVGTVNQVVRVSYATNDGTATTPLDYQPRGGTLTFNPGATAASITVPIVGDTFNETTEAFFVMLSNPQGARLVKSVGIGTIIDNDPLPSFYVNDALVSTISPGVVGAVFTVALDNKSGREVKVHYATLDNTALAGASYTAQAGDLTFLPGVSSIQLTVPIMGSAVYEPNERFFFDLSAPGNAMIADGRGIGTIVFGDPPPSEFVVDDGDAGFSANAGWVNLTNLISYQLDYTNHAAGNGSGLATWTFNSLPSDTYQVFTRWSHFSNRATNAPYTILDGTTSLDTVAVNQQVAPVGDTVGGIAWQSLGTYQISSGTLRVRLSDGANGYVIADAVRIVSGGGVPQIREIDVAGFEHSIADGDASPVFDDATEFGTVATASNSVTHTFTVLNTGNTALHLTGSPRVQVSGEDAADFTVVRQPDFSVAPGGTTTFDVLFHPSDTELRQATISIASDDDSESLYDFAVQGTGGTPGPSQFTIDDSTGGFAQAGNWATGANTLAHLGVMRTSAAGSGNDRATWTFVGLAPGQYEVFATWVPFGNRATNAPFTIANGDTTSTALVNQQQSSAAGNGTSLGTIEVTRGLVSVTLSDNANGYVVADSVTIVRQGAVPVVQAIVPLAHNAAMPQDVNADGRISPIDAMLVINSLLAAKSAGSGGRSATPLAATASASTTTSRASQYFVDVNGDGHVSPLDAMLVINYLIGAVAPASAAGGGSAAGGSVAPQADAGSTSVVPAVMAAVAVDQAIDQMSRADETGNDIHAVDPALAAGLATASASTGANATRLTPAVSLAFFALDEDEAEEEDELDSQLLESEV